MLTCNVHIILLSIVSFVSQTTYFSTFKQVYTAGYATSLISLISAIFVFTVFR